MFRTTLATTVLIGVATGPATFASTDPVEPEANPENSPAFTAAYNAEKGFRIISEDGDIQVKLTGVTQLDMAWMSPDNDLELSGEEFTDGVEFRRAWLGAQGKLYDAITFKARYGFEGESGGAFKDVWMAAKLGSWGSLRAGLFKEPFGLEQLTGGSNITFNERALDAFTPSRNTGMMLHGAPLDGQMTWSAGVFRDTDAYGDDTDGGDSGEYNLTGRVTGAPILSKERDNVLHLGAGLSFRSDNAGSNRLSQKPMNHQAPTLLDTGSIASKGYLLGGLEAAWTQGPLSLQGEFHMADVNVDDGDDETLTDVGFTGYYLMASYFLTGEFRPYSTKTGTFGRVKPKGIWGRGGIGAWELALRFASVDLNDGSDTTGLVNGGELDNITVQANWYLNPNARVMFGFNHAMFDNMEWGENASGKGELDSLLIRMEISF
jgi:phosphate-selective porin OprO and OprP